MTQSPETHQLLQAVLEEFDEKIVPTLPRSLRKEAAMIKRGLRLVGAEMEAEPAISEELTRLWSSALPEHVSTGDDLDTIALRSIEAIRSGFFDTSVHAPRLIETLIADAEMHLKVSNPKFIYKKSETD